MVISNGLAKGEAAHLEGAQLGTIDIVPIGSAPIGGMFEAAYQALDLPFFWSSREQVWKVMDGPIGQELLKRMEAKGVKGFCFGGGWGFRNMMVNKRPILVPDDMKGLTIRVQESPTYVAFMKALGANPVPMPYVEVYLAMKQGTIDGMELPSFTMTSDKFQEVTRYYSLTRHSYPPIAYFMNMKRYQSLAPDLQKVVADSMQQACAAHRRFEVEKEKQDLDVMKKAGTQVNEVKDLKAFQALMKPVYAGVEQQVGKEFMDRLTAAAQAAK
ncbi:MAG TPA: TRAP transporter substrate-binding protein [Methylomirabilota bacterium]